MTENIKWEQVAAFLASSAGLVTALWNWAKGRRLQSLEEQDNALKGALDFMTTLKADNEALRKRLDELEKTHQNCQAEIWKLKRRLWKAGIEDWE